MEVSMAVAITRTDLSARELRAAASKAKDAKAARRMMTLALTDDHLGRLWRHSGRRQRLRGWHLDEPRRRFGRPKAFPLRKFPRRTLTRFSAMA
jgi:hypothetical protein